jgi:predicted type IV restriction endonuclease
MTLVTTIGSIADRINKNSYRNETDVREAIVNRILYELGWDIYDPSTVRREYTVDKRRVDYALFTSTRGPSVFIEVKAPNSGDDGDRQLFEYAFHQGTPFVILVNGREWSFYLPAEQGSYSERRVQKLDLLERDAEDSARVLERYLKYDRARDGSAYSDARADYQSAARQREAEKAIPRAWQELISQPDELLIELIAEKVVSLIGFRPIDEQIEAFLLAPSVTTVRPFTTERTAPLRRVELSPETQKPVGTRKVPFQLLGQKYTEPDAISALIFVLRRLAERDSGFLESFAKQAPGRTRNHIAKTRSEVYPGKPELEAYSTEIAPGWWLGTNIANREKDRLAKIACDVSGLKFGKDLVIQFPNAMAPPTPPSR